MCSSTESIKSKKRRHDRKRKILWKWKNILVSLEGLYKRGEVYIKYGKLLSIKTWKYL